jgi:formate C-acetyltransferase
MKYFIKLMLEGYNIVGSLHATRAPAPFASATVDDCIKNGRSIQEGGAKYNFSGCFMTSLANAADSLAAIGQVVFQDGTLTLAQLNRILLDDFKGQERTRQLLLNRPPKYGNDNDFVDGLARRCVSVFADELEKYRDSRGGRYVLSILSQSFNVLQGKSLGATPDGRRAFEPLSDNASPVMGRDINGPTAMVKSVSKIDQMKPLIGTLLNVKFDPAITRGDSGLKVLKDIVVSYFDLMGEHIQINVVGRETLRQAQANPAEFKNLMVRVAGYSAYFIELDRDVQENIIARTQHTC